MASKYLKKFPVPENFPEILHDFAREILRDQPADIVDYGHEYFKAKDEGLDFDYKNKGKNIPPAASRKVENKGAAPAKKAEETKAENPKKEEAKTGDDPQSRVSSAKANEQEAKKYVNDMIEKLSQDDEDEDNNED